MKDFDLNRINAVSPYLVGKVREGVFIFRTETGVIYSVMFKPDMEIANSQTYQFVIDRQSESKGGHAERVRDTIIVQNTHPHYVDVITEFDALAEMYSQKPE